ncbi:hypothetical protein MKP08_09375 [Erythrobacter sp. LQ02-29]|uniref:hypothetical protein n=1 Tax=Erythrobacter sp. LQ02-29 TaxID=2920384 RepID=UPI001F4DA830|nr:hypothetical protein [Erythrobacter sp. LQ02-29]MCP9222956.1 hypothetical protein [Erythrobacter sp. LQ02-29]
MQIVRTIVWVLILFALLAFSFFNWREVDVVIWEDLILQTKIPALVVVSFLLGLVPTWLWSRGIRWSLQRKINSLETAARTNTATAAPVATTTPHPVTAPPPATAATVAKEDNDYRENHLAPAAPEAEPDESERR